MNITPAREEIISALHMLGPSSPKAITEATGGSPGATRELLSQMVKSGHIVTQARGVYSIPTDKHPDNADKQPDIEPDNAGVPDIEPDIIVGKEVIPAKQPTWNINDGALGVYSEQHGGTVPYEEYQKFKHRYDRSGEQS